MADILELIERRRSVRRYTPEPVTRKELELLLRAGMAAPSASGRKPWYFVVVTEEERLAALRRRLPLGRYNAPAAIIVCGDLQRAWPPPARNFWVVDCSAALQNIMLAASGIGLGSVCIGVYPLRPLMLLVARAMRLPRSVQPLALVWVGHPAANPPPLNRYDPQRVHWQEFRR
ncbi:MAG: nitroreductase family protein [Anaerolineae bacterium]|jgi:nitroreductase|nr:nitroreductase family protein [Chloroflexota bacterium]